MEETRVVLVARDPARAAALASALQTHAHVHVHIARTRAEATATTRAAPARAIVLIDLHLDVPNAGLELLHHLARACPRAELFLLAPRDRFPEGVAPARAVDEDEAPDALARTLLGTAVPTADMDNPDTGASQSTTRARKTRRGRTPSR